MTTRRDTPKQDDEARTAEYIDELLDRIRTGTTIATDHELECLERYRRTLDTPRRAS